MRLSSKGRVFAGRAPRVLTMRAASLALAVAAFSASPRLAGAVDIEILGMEVTQTVQDLDSSVRLVAKKDTWVRVHARSPGGEPIDGVVTRIVASRVAPGPVQFLGVIDSAPKTVTENPFRPNINSSFNVQIPYAWRSGTVHIVAVVDFPDDVDEDDEANNAVFQAVTFESTPPLRVRLIGVDTPNGNPPGQNHYTRTASWLRRTFPTSALLMQQKAMATPVNVNVPTCNCPRNPNNTCSNTGTCTNAPGRQCNDDDQDCGCAFLNELLIAQRTMDSVSDPDFEPDRRYAALVDDAAGFMRGCSPGADAKVASGPAGSASNGWDEDGSYADWYTAHELGHAYGRPHAGCCGAGDPGFFPHMNCAIGTGDMAGFDAEGPSASTSNRRDVMSYCNSLWTSDYTFEAILDRLQLEDGDPPPPPGVLGNFAMIVGNANLDLDEGSLTSVQRLASNVRAVAASGTGDWEVRFLNASGGIVSSAPLTLHEIYDDHDLVVEPFVQTGIPAPRRAIFAEIVDVPAAGVASLGLFHAGVQLDSRTVSSSAPIVTLDSPNGGESVGRMVTVSWTASDADSDPLTAVLSYSADDGATWQQVASQLSGVASLVVDLEGLPGGPLGRFRVDVSDGYFGASDTSDDIFTVDNAAPRVTILSPGDATTIGAGEPVVFEGLADDAEDGILDGTALAWESDRQGSLGTGALLELATELVPGTHEITLRATDSDGNETTASIALIHSSTAADFCPAFEREDCDGVAKAKIKLQDRRGDSVPTLLVSMTGDTPREAVDFGAPDDATTEVVCLYEAGILREAHAVAPSESLWKATGERGYRYRAPDSGGISAVSLSAGAPGDPSAIKASMRGKGSGVPSPENALSLPVVAQLANSTQTRCVSAEFGPADVVRNERRRFVAKR